MFDDEKSLIATSGFFLRWTSDALTETIFWVWRCAGYSEEDIERRFRLDLVAMHLEEKVNRQEERRRGKGRRRRAERFRARVQARRCMNQRAGCSDPRQFIIMILSSLVTNSKNSSAAFKKVSP